MENKEFNLQNYTITAKEVGYMAACNDLSDLLNELERSQLLSSQLATYIHRGLIAKRNIYVNKLTNEYA
jgi:hypothetical protein